MVGPPELVIEVANTAADYDLHQKPNVYRRHGVPESGVWRTLGGEFDLRLRSPSATAARPPRPMASAGASASRGCG